MKTGSDLRSSYCLREINKRKQGQRKKYNSCVQVMNTKMMTKWSSNIKNRKVVLSSSKGPVSQTKMYEEDAGPFILFNFGERL